MSIEEQLKSIILSEHKSVHAFSNEVGIANSTIDSILKRGIEKSGIMNVMKIFSALNLDIESIPSGTLRKHIPPSISFADLSNREMQIVLAYRRANANTKKIVEVALEPYIENEREKSEIAIG